MRQSNAGFLALISSLAGACRGVPEAPSQKPSAAAMPTVEPPTVEPPAASQAPTVERKSRLLPASAAPGQSPTWTTCFEHFEPAAAAHVDVLRLGMLCGPSNGLSVLARATGLVDEAHAPFVYQWEGERGDCFRVFGVAEEPVEDLEVEVFGPHHERLFLENQNHRWVVASENGPFCAPHEGTFEAQFSTHGGHGTVAISVWRGARMLATRAGRTKL